MTQGVLIKVNLGLAWKFPGNIPSPITHTQNTWVVERRETEKRERERY